MYEEHIRAAARSMAENMQRSPVPMYGKGLRLPDKGAVIGLLKEIRRLVFPAYYGDPELMTLLAEDYTALLLERIEGQLTRQIALALPEEQEQRAPMLAREVVEALPGVQRLLLTDLDATFESDPAANSKEEILFAYPGLFAIFVYRVAHELYLRQIPMIPRIMSEYAHSRTGIDIHPGAQIGAHFFIDHGTGIVVGNALEDLQRVLDAGLRHRHRLEAPLQRRVLLDILAVFVEGGGSDDLDLPTGQGGLEDVGGVHAALGISGPHDVVYLVDDQNDVAQLADLLDEPLHAALELSPELGTGHQSRQI